MINRTANRMVSKSFASLEYEYCKIDWDHFTTREIGIYIHVPFCPRLCAFCPFHRVLYNRQQKDRYLKALLKEIDLRGIYGEVEWVYIGGGTPNLLKPDEICMILDKLKEHVNIEDITIEGKPRYFTREYLEQLYACEISKLSIGVESLKEESLDIVERDKTGVSLIEEIVNDAHDLGMVVNADLMVGLPKQYSKDVIRDVKKLADLELDQMSTYPFTKAPGAKNRRRTTSKHIFEMIEKAADVIEETGYVRENVWVFSRPKLATKSLTEDPKEYIGYGPSAFSVVGNLQVVNPHIENYIDAILHGRTMGFKIDFDEGFNAWRRFAHRLYDLRISDDFIKSMPRSIRWVSNMLKLMGYIKDERVTRKGRYFIHDLTTTVIEKLPFPLGNPVSRGVACMNIFF
ncbi:MAG: radical SAM protein [Candidatus Lokiarchaeota archaeon]|nr:radical SAM protein [Candidatus Lokiarchaeota archaeon]